MDSQNILKTAFGVGILGTLAIFLTYSYSGDDSSETSETNKGNEGNENMNASTETSTTMKDTTSNKDGSMSNFWRKTYNNITNKQ